MSQRLRALENIIKQQNRLKQIRSKHHLDGAELKKLLFKDNQYQKYVQPIYNHIEENKHIFTHHNHEGQNRQQMRKEAAKMTLAAMKFCKIDLVKQPSQLMYVMWAFTTFDGGILTKAALQYFLYCKSIILFGNQPEHQTFLADALSLKDLGCFGLTEFYHGSYSKEIQTLATYEKATKQFVLTTQGRKGMKYWIGGASELANMSTIWAQLIVDGKSYGPHPFIVPLRCKKTHKVLPGITIGDCGPKNGLNYIDNGYIILDNVRLPRVNLLGKYGSVEQDGQYNSIISSNSNRSGFHMSPLSGGRGMISFSANAQALKAATSALRYACIRKQFDNPKKTDEVLIIDYSITKNRLIPEIAQAIVQISPGFDLARRYFSQSLPDDLNYVAELHAISACVKARVSWNCSSTTQTTRSILGGHGYSAFSNFSSFFHDTDVNNTWEGDNNMLLQQTSKYLMKVISKKRKTPILNLSFLWQPLAFDQAKIVQSLRNPESLDSLLKNLLFEKYNNALKSFEDLSKLHKEKHQIWLHFHPEAGNSLSLCYADFFIYSVTRGKVLQAQNQNNKTFLLKCLQLWGFTLLEKERFGSLQLRKALQKEIILLNQELTGPSVIATDILMPSSYITGGVFGEFQGNGFAEYLNLIYSSKDTFRRIGYFEQLIDLKNKG